MRESAREREGVRERVRGIARERERSRENAREHERARALRLVNAAEHSQLASVGKAQTWAWAAGARRHDAAANARARLNA